MLTQNKPTLLLVDDDPTRSDRIQHAMECDGENEVELCRDGSKAIECLAQGKYALVLLQWELAGATNAASVLLRCQQQSVSTICFSSQSTWSWGHNAKSQGATSIFLDRSDNPELPGIIRELLSPPQKPRLLDELRNALIGTSPAWLSMLEQLARYIDRHVQVTFTGETGAGKNYLARLVATIGHPGADYQHIKLSDTPETLIASELFGHKKGAFTGATEYKLGRLRQVGVGVAFIDEIGELPLDVQRQLLGVLDDDQFRPVGEDDDVEFKGRFVFATNRDLYAEVKAGRFRRDLHERLGVNQIHVPSLRDRGNDRELLWNYFLQEESRGRPRPYVLSREASDYLQIYPFPHNVRQLRNVINNSVVNCDNSHIIRYEHLPWKDMGEKAELGTGSMNGDAKTLSEQFARVSWSSELFDMKYWAAHTQIDEALATSFDKQYLELQYKKWRTIEATAEAIGLSPKTLKDKCEKAGVRIGR